jgi:hypothetical protein
MVFVPYHYLIHYQNINHIYKFDIHREYDKSIEISLLINVLELHEIHIILMLVQNVLYTKKKSKKYIFREGDLHEEYMNH